MKNKRKYPDQVVYDEDQGFNAGILPYPTNVSAPVIKQENVSFWKQSGVNKVNHQLKTKFKELTEEYQKLVDEFKWNELVYSSKFNFEPIIGETYHLYVSVDGKTFLSLISPYEWNREYVGSFTLDSGQKWIKIKD